MKNVYIYPYSKRVKNTIVNPYINNVIECLSRYYNFVNKNAPSNTGIIDLLKYFLKLNYLILNWPENIPDKKSGILQTIIFFNLLIFFKITGKSVIWIMHNKSSHYTKNKFLKNLIFKVVKRYSDYILTHSNEGVEVIKETSKRDLSNVKYLPHPVKEELIIEKKEKKYDILIWGTIIEYKGIDKFLEFLVKNHKENDYRILIVGHAYSKEYFSILENYSNKNIKILNQYLSDDDLKSRIAESKTVLFTYNRSSVLSSGALMDSLSFRANVVGPNVGSFRDLAEEKIVNVYDKFEDLIKLLDKLIINGDINSAKIEEFIRNNTWGKFGENIYNWLK